MHLHKVTSIQTSELQPTRSGRQAALEVDCGLLGCLKVMRWDGKRFAEDERRSIDTKHIFGFTEGADIGGKGDIELESTLTNRFGKSGDYGVLVYSSTDGQAFYAGPSLFLKLSDGLVEGGLVDPSLGNGG